MKCILGILLAVGSAQPQADRAQSDRAHSDRYAGPIYKAMRAGNLQSVSAAIIVDGRLQHRIAKGYANRWTGVRATPETIYPFGAITRTFTATSVAKLATERKLGLDDPLEKHLLGIRVRGQDPAAPVTIRHVLAHAAGILDSREPMDMHHGVIPAVPPLLLLSDVLFTANRPLSEVRYSAVGYGALALMLSGIAGQPVPDYFRKTWTEPLALRSTVFHGGGPIEERLAVGYTRGEEDDPAPVERYYHSPSSPLLGAEGLLGTASDLAQWLLFHLNRGKAADGQWMQPYVFDDMHRVQYPELAGRKHIPQSLFGSDQAGWGLGWISWPCDGDRCIAHTGSTRGYTAIVAGNLDRKTGVAILTNSDSAESQVVHLAIELMLVAVTDRANAWEHSDPTREERSEDET